MNKSIQSKKNTVITTALAFLNSPKISIKQKASGWKTITSIATMYIFLTVAYYVGVVWGTFLKSLVEEDTVTIVTVEPSV